MHHLIELKRHARPVMQRAQEHTVEPDKSGATDTRCTKARRFAAAWARKPPSRCAGSTPTMRSARRTARDRADSATADTATAAHRRGWQSWRKSTRARESPQAGARHRADKLSGGARPASRCARRGRSTTPTKPIGSNGQPITCQESPPRNKLADLPGEFPGTQCGKEPNPRPHATSRYTEYLRDV